MGTRKLRDKQSNKSGLIKAQAPPDYQEETPKFCLRHVAKGFGVRDLTQGRQSDFAHRIEKLCGHTWKELRQMGKHSLGWEKVTWELKPARPAHLEDASLIAFRYSGDNRPMVGYRVNDVFHVVWIEDNFGDLYNH